MTNTAERDRAVAELRRTTVTYGRWNTNVKNGVYANPATETSWGRAFAALARITDVPPAGAPVPTQPTLLLPRLDQPAQTGVTNSGTPTFVLAASRYDARYRILVDGKTVGDFAVTQGPNLVRFQVGPLPDGLHVVHGEELQPNPGYVVTPVTFEVDTARPSPPGTPKLAAFADPDGNDTTTAPHPTVIGTGEPGLSVRVMEGAAAVGGATVDASGNWTAALVIGVGVHVVHAVAVDRAGNVSGRSGEYRFEVT